MYYTKIESEHTIKKAHERLEATRNEGHSLSLPSSSSSSSPPSSSSPSSSSPSSSSSPFSLSLSSHKDWNQSVKVEYEKPSTMPDIRAKNEEMKKKTLKKVNSNKYRNPKERVEDQQNMMREKKRMQR